MPMCLTLGLTILAPTTETKLDFYSKCTVGAPGWSDRASRYLRIALVLFTALYMHLFYPSVD